MLLHLHNHKNINRVAARNRLLGERTEKALDKIHDTLVLYRSHFFSPKEVFRASASPLFSNFFSSLVTVVAQTQAKLLFFLELNKCKRLEVLGSNFLFMPETLS